MSLADKSKPDFYSFSQSSDISASVEFLKALNSKRTAVEFSNNPKIAELFIGHNGGKADSSNKPAPATTDKSAIGTLIQQL